MRILACSCCTDHGVLCMLVVFCASWVECFVCTCQVTAPLHVMLHSGNARMQASSSLLCTALHECVMSSFLLLVVCAGSWRYEADIWVLDGKWMPSTLQYLLSSLNYRSDTRWPCKLVSTPQMTNSTSRSKAKKCAEFKSRSKQQLAYALPADPVHSSSQVWRQG